MSKKNVSTEHEQWGIPCDEVEKLGERLHRYFGRFRSKMRTRTRDTSSYGFEYISGLLRMDGERTIANIGRKTEVSGQNLQHFISNSTWSGPGLIKAVQQERSAASSTR